jgi:hypothetical protein
VIPVSASAAWKGLGSDEETVIGRGFAGRVWPRLHAGNSCIRPYAGHRPGRLRPLVPDRIRVGAPGVAAPVRDGPGTRQPPRPAVAAGALAGALSSQIRGWPAIRAAPGNSRALIFALKSGAGVSAAVTARRDCVPDARRIKIIIPGRPQPAPRLLVFAACSGRDICHVRAVMCLKAAYRSAVADRCRVPGLFPRLPALSPGE